MKLPLPAPSLRRRQVIAAVPPLAEAAQSWEGLDGIAGFLLGHAQIVDCLQVQPELRARVEKMLLEDLERGAQPRIKPWGACNVAASMLPRRHNGIPYQGVNVLMPWGEAIARGYIANTWMTSRQAQELGALVRKGEHGSLVVYADRIKKMEEGGKGGGR